MKYDKIVAISKEKSKKKANIAITQIQKMLENQERITVEVLRKRTGFSKSFFYRNQEVWRVLENARSKQQMPCNSMEVIRAIEAEDEIINLRIQITKLKSLRQKLLEENKRLRQELRELSQGQSGICDRENPNPSICSELWVFADR